MAQPGCGDGWDTGTAVPRGGWGQPHSGFLRWLGHRNSHAWGCGDSQDVGTAMSWGCGDGCDEGDSPAWGHRDSRIPGCCAWGRGDSWDTRTCCSLLPLSPGLAVALGLSLLPPATQPAPAAPRDDERAGSGPQGQGHRRPAPVFSEGGRPAHPPRLPPHGSQRLPGAEDGHRGVSPGFKISKIIVVGDLSVGKTCLINRFCKDTFDKNYKATIGVDFEMERFEVLGVPFSLQLWDTAGQERFKCIASTYYRGAQAIVIVFDVNDVASLEHTRQWLADALKENDPSNVILFLVGSKKDLSTPAQYSLMEKDALKVAQEMQAEYWAVSSLTGENVRDFFFRVAALTFESSVLAELERSSARKIGDTVRISSNENDLYLSAPRKKPKCCQ
ncbi:ras-related protein Rab-34 isoform X1 [Strix aluco]|uniref:ras-related protein Rab-34 isoform X1 n=1 Tax=Strix aluco TaxID=111821 RepID=UPI003DA69082